ncbi:MAG: Hsp33 family molecular chaperone HslO [Pseudomonadota bacterium]
MDNGDFVARYLLPDASARIVVVHATGLTREAARRHGASGAAALAMGRAGMAGLLLATLTKNDERVTLQILGNGPLGALTVDASASGTARMFVGNPALARFAGDRARPRLGDVVGRTGLINVARDLGLRERFGGQTAMVDGEIDTDVERYLVQSEQIDSALACEVIPGDEGEPVTAALGILVQALPGGMGTDIVAEARRRMRGGAVATQLASLDAEPTALAIDALAYSLLPAELDTPTRLDGTTPVRFFCPCSRERAAATLALLGERDLTEMIQEEGEAQVTCEFCRNRYDFSDETLEEIRRGSRKQPVAPS